MKQSEKQSRKQSICAVLDAMSDWQVFANDEGHAVDFICRRGNRIVAVISLELKDIKSTDHVSTYLPKDTRRTTEVFAFKTNSKPYYLVEFMKDKKLFITQIGEQKDYGDAFSDYGKELVYLLAIDKMTEITQQEKTNESD